MPGNAKDGEPKKIDTKDAAKVVAQKLTEEVTGSALLGKAAASMVSLVPKSIIDAGVGLVMSSLSGSGGTRGLSQFSSSKMTASADSASPVDAMAQLKKAASGLDDVMAPKSDATRTSSLDLDAEQEQKQSPGLNNL